MVKTSDKIAKRALELLGQEYSCAQSVLRAVLEHYDMMFEYSTLVSAGFGGGIAHQGEICGAVSGAIMALGILEGQNTSDHKEHKIKTYDLGEKFIAKFREKFETTKCSDLTGVDITDENARNKASQDGHFARICPQFVDYAVRIILDMFPD